MPAEKKEKWFKRIFVLTFATYVLPYLIVSIQEEEFEFFFYSLLAMIPLICLYGILAASRPSLTSRSATSPLTSIGHASFP